MLDTLTLKLIKKLHKDRVGVKIINLKEQLMSNEQVIPVAGKTRSP